MQTELVPASGRRWARRAGDALYMPTRDLEIPLHAHWGSGGVPSMGVGCGVGLGDDSGAFLPTQIANCVLWLRSDLGITLNSGNVSAWADQSGSGHNFVQATGTKQPAYGTSSGANGNPGLTFVAANSQVLSVASQIVTSAIACTLFGVHKYTTVGGIFFTLGNAIGFGDSAGNRDFMAEAVADQTDGANTTNFEKWTGTVAAGPLWSLRVNGAAQTVTPNNSTPIALQASSSVGAGQNGATAFANMIACEYIVYDRVLSAAEIATVEAYFLGRYGI